jgi:transposase
MRLFPRGRRSERWGCGGYIKPSYSPELNPAEQVFAAVRRWVEGRRYERIEAKKAAVEEVPRRLEAEAKVSSLVGRPYIRQALNTLLS